MSKITCCNCDGSGTVSVSVPCPVCKGPEALRIHDAAPDLYKAAKNVLDVLELAQARALTNTETRIIRAKRTRLMESIMKADGIL